MSEINVNRGKTKTDAKEPEVKEAKATVTAVKKSAVAKSKVEKEGIGMDTSTLSEEEMLKKYGTRTMPKGMGSEGGFRKSQGVKTMGNTDQSGCKQNVPDTVFFGEDLFKLLSKASSEEEGWLKSTKSMDTGSGCVVQVTTQQRNPDGSYAVAEAITYVPGVKIREEYAGGVGGTVSARCLVARH